MKRSGGGGTAQEGGSMGPTGRSKDRRLWHLTAKCRLGTDPLGCAGRLSYSDEGGTLFTISKGGC